MIYFVQPLDGGPVKIGFTDNLPARLKQLEHHYQTPLAVLATMDGDRARETEIHDQFSHLRFGDSEQFRPAPELMEFIGRPLLVGPNPDAVEAMEPRALVPIVNLKGNEAERDWLRALVRKTGVPASTIVRRGIAMWAQANTAIEPPEDWKAV